MPKVRRPKLVNRGPAGLLDKLPKNGQCSPSVAIPAALANGDLEINNISEGLVALAVDIDSLTPDPMNARLHPERNMESIRKSLMVYGQLKPIVVRKEGRIIVAGNGTWQAAKDLGWTKIAANFTSMTTGKAAGFGLADNRTAELAKWDIEMVARLDQLIQMEGDGEMVGWSDDEIQVLRMADWTPPAISDEQFSIGSDTVAFKVSKEDNQSITRAIEAVRKREKDAKKWDDGKCLSYICRDWLGEEPYSE